LATFAATFGEFCSEFCSDKVKFNSRVKRILEVLFPEKTSVLIALIALIAGERSSTHAGPILPFLFLFSGDSTSIFPGIVLPFCYFSVVRKVTEKPVLFLPHPISC
jgi:hypothetical protein